MRYGGAVVIGDNRTGEPRVGLRPKIARGERQDCESEQSQNERMVSPYIISNWNERRFRAGYKMPPHDVPWVATDDGGYPISPR